MNAPSNTDLSLRHAVATLAYRGAKAIRGAPPDFTAFRAGEGSRSAGEILAHIGDLLDWALSLARGDERWENTQPKSWAEDSARFFAALSALDACLASGGQLRTPPGKLFQGAVADALAHVGQIALLRRIAGTPIRAENYAEAAIQAGRTGADQLPPVAEFD